MTLVNYIKFSVTSLDNAWTSKPIFAIIAPGLCLPLILGLPFLVKNNIIIDHADRTAVVKVSSYNLLNPPIIKLPGPPPPKLREHIKQTKKIKKKVLSELLTLCNDCIKNGTLPFEDIKEVDYIGAIRNAIEKLSAEEHLIKLGIKVKSDFPDIFEPVPHANLLPSNYLTCIKLKDTEKQIKTTLILALGNSRKISKLWSNNTWMQDISDSHLLLMPHHPSLSLNPTQLSSHDG